MAPFLDVIGVSGASYRFRAVERGAMLPIEAGNFLVLREGGAEGERPVCCGTAPSLARATSAWAKSIEENGRCLLYIRLNLTRHVRLAEHADISAALRPKVVLEEVVS